MKHDTVMRVIFFVVAFPAVLVVGAIFATAGMLVGFINGIMWATGVISGDNI